MVGIQRLVMRDIHVALHAVPSTPFLRKCRAAEGVESFFKTTAKKKNVALHDLRSSMSIFHCCFPV